MKWRWVVLTLVLLGLSTRRVAAQAAAEVRRFAIVIGNNQPYRTTPGRLRYADDDAVATHQLLLDAGVDSHLLVTLDDDSRQLYPSLQTDGAPSLRHLERVFATLSDKMRARAAVGDITELLLFYSGHGDVENGEGFVVLEGESLTRTKLYALLTRSPATRNHVFVDACKSYFLVFARGPGGKRKAYAAGLLDDTVPGRLANTGFVLSTSSDRESHEWEHYQAGVFSYELRSALRGAADVDVDGRVSYGELGAFLTIANQGIRNAKLRPDFMVRPPRVAPTAAILGWSSDRAVLRIDGSAGHTYVETARGERLLDAHPAPGESVRLHLPRLRPLFVRRNDESAEYVVTSETTQELALLQPVVPQIARKGALNLAFEQLFTLPFGLRASRELERRAQNQGISSSDSAPAMTSTSTTSAAQTLGTVAGWTAIAAGGAAVTLSGASLLTYLNGDVRSQVAMDRTNERIRKLNVAAIAGYGLAAAAGLTWTWVHLGVDATPPTTTARRVTPVGGFTLQLQGQF
jgi:hypothetical protein